MKVQVNLDMCEGHGRCAQAAPQVFALSDNDQSEVLLEDVPADLVEQVNHAIRVCPRQAIAWLEDA